MEPLPPPPPPPQAAAPVPEEQADQLLAFNMLKELGYQVEQVSPWKLVTELLGDVVKGRDASLVERAEWEMKVETEKRRADQAEKEQLDMIKDIAEKFSEMEGKVEERKLDLLHDALFERGDVSSRQVSEMVARNKRLEREISRLREALTDSQLECQRLVSIATYAASGKEDAFLELKNQKMEQSEAERATERLGRQLEEERQSRAALLEEFDAVKVEHAKLEGIRDSLLSKLEKTSRNLASFQEAKTSLEAALERSREETKVATELASEERRSRKQLLAKLSEVEKENSTKNDEVQRLEKEIQDAQKSKLALEEQLGILKRQIATQTETIFSRDGELREAKGKLDELEALFEQEKKAHASRLHELRSAAMDVANMARENRELTNGFERMGRELREVKSALDESRAKTQRLAGMLDAAKLERSELLTVYRKSGDENAKLREELKSIAVARQELLQETKTHDEDLSTLNKQLFDLDLLCKKQQIDLQNYDRRVDGLSRELRACRTKCEALEEGKTIAERSAGNEQQRLLQTSRQAEEMRWELDQTRQELGSCAQRLERALEENAKLAEQLVAERLKIGEMEAQVERARIGQAKALISSGRAFTTTSPSPVPPASTRKQDDEMSSSTSLSLRDFDDRYEELERVMGDDLSEASSVIRQTRESRAQWRTPSTSALGSDSRTSFGE